MWVDGTEDKRQSEGMSKRFGVGRGGGQVNSGYLGISWHFRAIVMNFLGIFRLTGP